MADDPISTTDPLQLLPSEIVLRILEFTTPACLASLTRLNHSWNNFIDETHQEAIYSVPNKSEHPQGSKDFSFLSETKSFAKYYEGTASWKDLCKRQTLLARNRTRENPITRESTVRVGHDPVWRFRPDFKRRIFLSTSHAGGMNVTDMDTGRSIWRLDMDTVRPFAHLEYQDGTAVWDREGNAVEVWRTDLEGLQRGEFRRIAVLNHDRMTRGFQLSFDTLCVVSNEGKTYVYDMKDTPTLRTQIDITDGAVGHLDQGPDAVVCSLGSKGYHFYDKTSGEFLGVLHPKQCRSNFHIHHPKTQFRRGPGLGNLTNQGTVFPPQRPAKDRTLRLELKRGHLQGDDAAPLEDDEWGAGMLSGNLMVGISRSGRVLVCSNWREALKNDANVLAYTSIIECDTDGSNFDLGGWLSIRDHKIMFEIQDLIYVVGLNDTDAVVPHDESPQRPCFATATSITAQLAVPVSFMGVYDDCIMTTYTTLHYRRRPDEAAVGALRAWNRVLPTKAIRVISLAPDLTENDDEAAAELTPQMDLPEINATQADLYQLIAMLAGDEDEDAANMAAQVNMDYGEYEEEEGLEGLD